MSTPCEKSCTAAASPTFTVLEEEEDVTYIVLEWLSHVLWDGEELEFVLRLKSRDGQDGWTVEEELDC